MLRAIIVDDEEWAVKRLKRILTENGGFGQIETFLNPRDAYEYAKDHPVDIAFLDISMPDVNGMKLSGLLRDVCQGIDIVFVTGSDEHAVQAFDMSALDYVMKPISSDRLASTMEKVRRMRRIDVKESLLEVMLFNGLRITMRSGGGAREAVKLRTPKTEELFVFLVCKRTVSREEAADTLWNGFVPDKAWKNLNSTLYYIRKAVDADKHESVITTAGNEIRVETGKLFCDMYEFERLLKEIRRAPERNVDLVERAEALYAGSLLRGKSYDWAIEFARRLEQQYIELMELAAMQYRQRSLPQQALYAYGEILKLDVIREDVHHETIRLLVELGRKNEAARQYRELEDVLERELGTRPDPRIKEWMRETGAF